jgi:hypothetical protein
MTLLLYYFAGVVVDIIVTSAWISATEGKAWSAAILSFFLTILSYGIFGEIILGPNRWLYTILYALGGAHGTWATVYFKKRKEK